MERSMSPIAIFAYNRPDHLRRTLASLMACDGFGTGPVSVFCDGAKTPNQRESVVAAREVARDMLGSAADLRLAPVNRGLAASIIAGVSELTALHGRVIVVEDDLDLAPRFLRYMNEGLCKYADDPGVFQISGHAFDVPEFAAQNRAMFLPLTSTWGWATWDRAWRHFDPQAVGWQALRKDRAMRRRFNLDGGYDYSTMLCRQMEGKRDSWGVRWYWTMFRAGGVALFPPRSLVRNMGQDGSGSHGGGLFRNFSGKAGISPYGPIEIPEGPAKTNAADFKAVCNAIWRQNGGRRGVFVDMIKRLVWR